ncbi:GtrA family protein [Kineosporia rhizophila]|uniref:GtrA family protein n=1 Tax=Kineosporia TaxID=49184 RepID=UPI000A45B82D|nr:MULTISPECIES: GtrA family protein [Kineosporia]MCE0536809.1 GtrA family protein [Kineosporia rhizophila]
MSADTALFTRLRRSVDLLYREVMKFGAVGGVAFVVDTGVFNLLLHSAVGEAVGLDHKPLTAKTISVLVATVVSWLGNRYWTFRHRRRASVRREFVLFGVMNGAGLAIALACLGFSRYILDLDSPLADNISGNVIGLALGTLFRFWAYRTFVFTHDHQHPADDLTPPGTPEAIAEDLAEEHDRAAHRGGETDLRPTALPGTDVLNRP